VAVSANAVLWAWETGQRRHPVDQALLLLQLAAPEQAWSDLAALSVGQRNSLLLQLREQLLGATLRCRVACPRCGVGLEFTLETVDLQSRQTEELASREIVVAGVRIALRAPNSLDLAAVVGAPDLAAARMLLLQRCVERATRRGRELAVDELPARAIEAVAEALEELDPLAALPLRLACRDCGHNWSTEFDVGAFVWHETSALARRLLREVHELATWYGWREADILSMSDGRRQAYLEMVRA